MLNLKPSLLLTYLIARFLALGRHRPPCPSLFSATLTQSAIPLARSGGRTDGHRSTSPSLPFPLCSVPLFPLDAMLHPEKIERRTNGHRTFIAHSLVRVRPPAPVRPSVWRLRIISPVARSFARPVNRGSNNNLKASLTIPHCERCRIAPPFVREVPRECFAELRRIEVVRFRYSLLSDMSHIKFKLI